MKNFRLTAIQIRCELWEHRGIFFGVPGALFLLIALASVIFSTTLGVGALNIYPTGAAHPGQVQAFVELLGGGLYWPFALALLFYLSSALYTDRRDKSVLFWRALPVSDFRSVVGKVLTAALAGPGIVWVATVLASIWALLALAIAASVRGADGFSVLAPIPIAGAWVAVAYAFVVQSLWWLPYFSWLLLTSALAPRAPLLWALLPPLIAGFVERIIFHTSHVFNVLSSHLTTAAIPSGTLLAPGTGHPASPFFFRSIANTTHLLTLPTMWIGVAIGFSLIFLTTYARRYSATK